MKSHILNSYMTRVDKEGWFRALMLSISLNLVASALKNCEMLGM